MTTDVHETRLPWPFNKAVFGLILIGAVVQILLSAYYLSVAHAPQPHELPVGYIAADGAARIEKTIDEGNQLAARPFGSEAAMTAAIMAKEIYGGVDVTTSPPRLYVASAAGVAAAATLRTRFTGVVDQQVDARVQQFVTAGVPVPPAILQQLTAPPAVTDVVPLPAADSTGASIGLLIQALAIGATVAAMGLGNIGAGTEPSVARGVGHTAALLGYAVGSAAAVVIAAQAFGVVPDGASWRLFWSCLLVSLAITGSVAGLVSLVGAGGSVLGTVYLLIGVAISGASPLPEFLPPVARAIGEALPTGAGTTLVRNSMYFPAASIAAPVTILALYAGVGIAIVLVTNALPNRSPRHSLLGATTGATKAAVT